MKSIGIICEYNPFHNGHLYHLNEVKRMYPDYIVILVMSSSFLQRGEPSIINKWDKTKIALHFGIDLIIELPFVFSSQSADFFAKGSIEILNYLKVNKLIFGSECGEIDKLDNITDKIINNSDYEKNVKKYINEGSNYPASLSKALYDINQEKINSPNDILGICYIKEIKKLKSNIIPLTIKRTNNFHSLELDNEIVSATSIRNAIINNMDIKKYVPTITYNYLNKNIHLSEDYFPILKYKILSELNNLKKYQTVDEGIENRIKKYIINSTNLDQLIKNIKTKRYTYNKIKRMLTHILCNFTKEEALNHKNIEYIRVLGFSKKGQQYLNKIKKELTIPLVTNYSKLDNKMLDIEFRVSSIYASILKEEDKINLIESEYKNKPLISE